MLGAFKDDYSDIFFESESNISKMYRAYNVNDDRECFLKIISLEELKKGDYDFHLERLKKEEEITRLCNSENTVNIYRKFQTKNHIIFELESCEMDLGFYLSENGELEREKDFFLQIVQDIAKAMKTLHSKNIIHRDIKPSNIFIYGKDDKRIIKLGDFGCATYKNENNSEQIGTYLYSAPEVLKNLEYDDKCDLWSLGITLFELYFGLLPYAPSPKSNTILEYIYEDKEWIFKKTKDLKNPPDPEKPEKPKENRKPEDIIPNLDVFFRRLLTIDPAKRMTFDEFYNYVFNNNFMKPGIIAINNNQEYKKIYQKAEKEPQPLYDEGIKQESNDDDKIKKENVHKVMDIIGDGHFPDIMDFANGSITDQKFNNIIYYDENVDKFKKSVFEDSDLFERYTTGAFILCSNSNSLKFIREEILKQIKRDKQTSFNLITTGSQCDKVMKFIKENKEFEKCIQHVCVYCMNVQKWSKLKNDYNIIYDVYNKKKDVINFINIFSSKEIKPFHLTKLIRYEDYIDKYKNRHFKISQFYGNLNPQSYEKYIEDIKKIIKNEEEKKELFNKDKNKLLEGFLQFNLSEDLKKLDALIVKEYTKNTFYGDLNKWLMNSSLFYEPVAYFTARLMYHLNSYAQENNLYCEKDKYEVLRGIKLNYSSLLPYERAVGKIILLSAFTSTSEDEAAARRFARRKDALTLYKTDLKFSVIFKIKNNYKKNWVSNGISVQDISQYKKEKEILYQPFSFYYVRQVEIDYDHYSADIFLETIGKKEILEEKIKMKKEIKYNKDSGIMEVVN